MSFTGWHIVEWTSRAMQTLRIGEWMPARVANTQYSHFVPVRAFKKGKKALNLLCE